VLRNPQGAEVCDGSIHRDIQHHANSGAVKQVTKAAVGAGSSTGIYSMGFAPPEQMAGEKSIHPQMPWR